MNYYDPSGHEGIGECKLANQAKSDEQKGVGEDDKKSSRKEVQREKWEEYTGQKPTGEVHHGLPEEFSDWFKSKGLDVNSGEY